MPQISCFIWGTPSDEVRPFDGVHHIYSPRSGGRYVVGEMGAELLKKLATDDKTRLTTWLCRQRSAGIEEPRITPQIIEDIKTNSLLTTSQRVAQVLLFFNKFIRLGETIRILHNNFFGDEEAVASHLAAVAECGTKGDLIALADLLIEMRLLRDTTAALAMREVTLTSDGWLKTEELAQRQTSASQAFVAMWFDGNTEEPYANGFHKAIFDSGYDPRRVDQKHHHFNKVDDEIISEIRRSRFLVADFTCAPGRVRGGVYFEAGFAMGLGIPIIWTCKDTSMEDLHFDTRQYPHIPWKNSNDLYTQLKARIGALIGAGPKRRV